MKKTNILKELRNHTPFTALATIIAIILSLTLYQTNLPEILFEILHPLHLLVSAIVTSAIFYKHKNKFLPALLIGITGAVIIGSLSDIIFPWLGGLIFQLNTTFHLPIIEKPVTILGVVLLGSIIGATTKITKLPHFLHVFLSVFASLFYLLAFSATFNFLHFIIAFVVVLIAVLIPCCISDIIYPLLFVRD